MAKRQRRNSKSESKTESNTSDLRTAAHDSFTATERFPRSVFGLGLLSSIVLWVAFPLPGIGLLAFVGLIPLLILIVRAEALTRKNYWMLWLSGCLLWLGLLQGIRLAFWPLYAGWVALALYVAVYTPLFVGLTRVAVHRFKFPLLVAAPLVWAGLECFRSYFLTGFSACLLGHTLVKWPILIQVADQLGGFGVGAFVVVGNVVLFEFGRFFLVKTEGKPIRSTLYSTVCGAAMVLAVLGYGYWRMDQANQLDATPLLRVALIQENSPTMFESNRERNQEAWEDYYQSTRRAFAEHGQVDLVVWPESCFTANEPYILVDSDATIPEEWADQITTQEQLEEQLGYWKDIFRQKIARLHSIYQSDPKSTPPQFLVGSDYIRFTRNGMLRYNTVLWIGSDGELADHYAKANLVMFGEYIPVLQWFPGVMRAIKLPTLSTGDKPLAMQIRNVTISPSICFENVIPQVMHGQVKQLTTESRTPDVLITVSNDGWFRGSSILDHHLASGVMTAVENRRPMLVAANTGLSAAIDGSGKIRGVGERLSSKILLAEPTRDNRWGLWQSIGDWPARLCAVFCVVLFVEGYRKRKRTK